MITTTHTHASAQLARFRYCELVHRLWTAGVVPGFPYHTDGRRDRGGWIVR